MRNFLNTNIEYSIMGFVILFSIQFASATTYIVGPLETYKKISEVTSLIDHGDTIFIKKGIYINDKQVTITKNYITVLGEAGRPVLRAGSIIANDQSNGKGIFVIKGNHVTIDNVAFYDSKVVDNNGAGIRQEGCDLKVLRCLFLNNEMGILCGTIPNCKTTIEYCEFYKNGSVENPGYQHNVYINNIDTLIFRFNISRDATAQGHELKSRAKFNYIAYNCIANYTTEDSRTIDLPNGGVSIVVGNVIEQGINSANNNILGYGLEGLSNPAPHSLYIANNTVVNRRGNGSFVHVPSMILDKFVMINNALVGGGLPIVGNQESIEYKNNISNSSLQAAASMFEDIESFNYSLVEGSSLIDQGDVTNFVIGQYDLIPRYEFHSLTKILPRIDDGKIDVGAYEFEKISSSEDQSYELAKIYPNPTFDFIYVGEYDGDEVDVMGVSRTQIYTCKVSSQMVDVSVLPSGLYTMKLGKVWHTFMKM